ncbi:MAG: ArsA family ATPase [Thermoanaerobaculia bacterium]
MDLLAQLAGRRLLVVTGKGGVGKSAVAATLGSLLARAGQRVLLLEVDPRENVHQMLGVSPSGGEIVEAAERLYLQNLQPRQVVDQLVRDRVPIELVVRRILASPLYHNFVEGAPGLEQAAILGHCLLLGEGRSPGAPPLDVVVLDAPATGHGVSLLAAPGLVSEAIAAGPVAELTGEVAELIADSERSATVVISLAEEMPVTEALELRAELATRLDRSPEVLVVNQLLPADPPPAAASETDAAKLWRCRRRLQEREMTRLAAAWAGERLELPLLPLDRGPQLIDALAAVAAGESG